MTKKIIIIVSMFLAIVCSMNLKVYADSPIDTGSYKPGSTTVVTNAGKLETIGNRIIGVIRIVGTIISVIALAVMGIKYMVGSVEEKAEYKKTMLPYLIGAIMLFGITNLLVIIQNFVGTL